MWRPLANSVLKHQLRRFFAEKTEFSKRLSAFQANSKFEDAQRGISLKSQLVGLRERFGDLSIYCWHTIGGYWGGVSTETAEMAGLLPTEKFPAPTATLLEVEPQLAWDAAEERGIQPSSALLAEICGYQISPRDVTSHPASLGASRDASRPELRGGLDDRLAPRVAAVGFPQPGSRSSLAPSILPPGASRGPSILPPGASRRVDEYVPAEGTTRPPSARFRSSRGVAPIY